VCVSVWVCVCVGGCIYVYLSLCPSERARAHVCSCVCVCVVGCAWVCGGVCVGVCVYVCMIMCAWVSVGGCGCIYVCEGVMFVCMCARAFL
jgi:hypothetical protein